MLYMKEDGSYVQEETFQDRFLKFLYTSAVGRVKLKFLTKPIVSKLGGFILNCPISTLWIRAFIRNHHIDMREYESKRYRSYNDFFTRRIRAGKRPLPENKSVFFSPCDGKASVYPIDDQTQFVIKDTPYTVGSLLKSKKIASHFKGGYAVVLRLSVDDYHRYLYVDDGEKSENYHIPGRYHTVNPIANDYVSVYTENTREFTMMKTKHFGCMIQVEVGALMVGRICNLHEEGKMYRGREKGYFEFGGSTIVLLLQENQVFIDPHFIENTKRGIETKIKQGQRIGEAIF